MKDLVQLVLLCYAGIMFLLAFLFVNSLIWEMLK